MSPCQHAGCARAWKGKGRAVEPAAASVREEVGGAGGVVLPLTMIQTSSYETVYTLPISVGTSGQVLSVQVDSGSSDLWIASNSCGTQACKQAGGNLYNPSSSTPTGQTFAITYVEGDAGGPIVWDQVDIGGYTVDAQALAAVTTVDDEPLSSEFSGVFGIALPANSVIASKVAPTTGNAPDGAVFASNLFTMTPTSSAPSARFMSLTLARPESNGGGIASQLGLGKHPPEIVKDPSQVQYDTLTTPSGTGSYFWQAQLSAINVWVDGVQKPVDIGTNANYPGIAPTAVIDSGMPIILTSRAIANAIYGAIGIGPGSDGQYYMSCTTPVNMSIVLDSRTAIPLHPLDLTVGASSGCMGTIQAYPAGSNVADVADIILGVPFMRSTYTVMAYDAPDAQGVFPNATQAGSIIHPRLGLMGVTNITTALDEFNTVRVLNQPLSSGVNQANNGGSGSGSGSGGPSGSTSTTSEKKLSVGVEVLIGLLGFFFLCFALFAARWAVHRRKLVKLKKQAIHGRSGSWDSEDGEPKPGAPEDELIQQQVALRLVRRSTLNSRYGPSEDTLRGSKYGEFKRRDSSPTVPRSEVGSSYFDETTRTKVGDADVEDKELGLAGDRHSRLSDGELGYRPRQRSSHSSSAPSKFDARDGDMGTWAMGQATLVDADGSHTHLSLYTPDDEHRGSSYFNPSVRDEYPSSPGHAHTQSSETTSVAVPLLAHTRDESRDDHGAIRRAPLGLGRPPSRARVGSFGSDSTPNRRLSSSDFALPDFDPSFVEGENVRTSMAGIGRSRIVSMGEPLVRPLHVSRLSGASVVPLLSPPALIQMSPQEEHVQVELSAETAEGRRSGAFENS
ncbi:aspartic peptidase domain-containing protein [Cytidiella melzeri]|nr:aspartic peptidase domain-containing protein [Cytidiella melzeri]